MRYSYDKFVRQYSNNFIPVFIEKEDYYKIEDFVRRLVPVKKRENHHKNDFEQEYKRHMTGYLGEFAVGKVLGMDIIDWSIGNSNDYNIPDIRNYKVGIKTVEKGKFPVIFKNNTYPQIFCIKDNLHWQLLYVCGIAPPSILNKYQDDDLILSKQLRERGTKTGFYGFQYLRPFRNRYQLESILDSFRKS